jgi:hypothetical protein
MFMSCVRHFPLFGLDKGYAQVGILKQDKILLVWVDSILSDLSLGNARWCSEFSSVSERN